MERPPQLDYAQNWDAAMDLTLRRFVYGSLSGAASALLLFRSPTTRWAAVAFGAGAGIGSACTDSFKLFPDTVGATFPFSLMPSRSVARDVQSRHADTPEPKHVQEPLIQEAQAWVGLEIDREGDSSPTDCFCSHLEALSVGTLEAVCAVKWFHESKWLQVPASIIQRFGRLRSLAFAEVCQALLICLLCKLSSQTWVDRLAHLLPFSFKSRLLFSERAIFKQILFFLSSRCSKFKPCRLLKLLQVIADFCLQWSLTHFHCRNLLWDSETLENNKLQII